MGTAMIRESYDAFVARDSELEMLRELLPLCVECKEQIQDDYYYEINGCIYCEECLNTEFRKDIEDYKR